MPGFVTPILTSLNTKNNIIGQKFDVKTYKTENILIYSDKLSEGYVSSQECLVNIIRALAQKHDCWLISDKKRPASAFYKSIAPSLSINMNSEAGIHEASNVLEKIKPSIIIPITQNQEFENIARNSYIYSLYPTDNITGLREVDYRFTSNSTMSHELPFSRSKKIDNVNCTVFAPDEGSLRSYIDGQDKKSIAGVWIFPSVGALAF